MGKKIRKSTVKSPKIYTLLPEHKARFGEWRDKWIRNAFSTKPMDAEERQIMRVAIAGLYRSAGLEPPPDQRIIFVPSPFVGSFAAGFAAWIWWMREHSAATRGATDDATRGATDGATYGATAGATDGATDGATYDATYDATAGATYGATRGATDGATYDATYDATDGATYDATYDATRDATAGATYGATRGATDDATRDVSRNWWKLGGCNIGDIAQLAEQILPGEKKMMLECAQLSWKMRNGGNQWSGFCAFITFFRYVAQLNIDYSKWDHYEKAALHAGPRWMHPKFCIVSDRPSVLKVDEQSKPHCDDGPFCVWRDGAKLYSVHGVRVSGLVVEHPEHITAEMIAEETNDSAKQIMLERCPPAEHALYVIRHDR